jgi:hypothetical protein
MTDTDEKRAFWNNLLRAIETEPHHVDSIQGASGFSHPVVALGVDEKTRRVVLISGEGDARSAALAYGDIQAAMPSVRLLMARPASVNLGQAAQIVSEWIGRVKIGPEELQLLVQNEKRAQQAIHAFVEKIPDQFRMAILGSFAIASLNMVAVWKDVVTQLSLVEMEAASDSSMVEDGAQQDAKPIPTFDLRNLIAYDPVAMDRRLGVCSIPLYYFTQEDVEVLHSGRDIEAARQLLKRLDVFQYFFPAADQLALGFVDQDRLSVSEIVQRLDKTPEIGHPFGQLEIVDFGTELRDIVDALQDKGLLVEGAVGVEITNEGASVRSLVKFKPREGLLARLSRIFSVKIDFNLKDFFR